ncbi:uncharacterized protein DNG_10007 [Cephalotrichum gorgonifer]|uniref:Uncharacterized protein n=1 Tax=Cephalotrichum gorgonifer TaxID=2041049 RepID=A0AAE8N8G4_9PEZI|nr:uncharacterized protein DNG_10007 [Cephalotrichum gorgonifer]
MNLLSDDLFAAGDYNAMAMAGVPGNPSTSTAPEACLDSHSPATLTADPGILDSSVAMPIIAAFPEYEFTREQLAGASLWPCPTAFETEATPDTFTFNLDEMDGLNVDGTFLNSEAAYHGAYRPPMACSHCQRHRLQCFILRTTSANPNPISSCSSCVALFRECSLAGQGKRDHSHFETPQPVIGQLHGVNEEYEPSSSLAPSPDELVLAAGPTTRPPLRPTVPPVSGKRSSSRSVHKNRALRTWFAAHIDHPYPSEEEKSAMAQQSGLSRTQVVNWFSNARRRHKMSAEASSARSATKIFPQGSPMPRSILANMTPLERWRSSPPDEEPVSASVISSALGAPWWDHHHYDSEPADRASYGDGSASSVSGSGDFNFHTRSLTRDLSSDSNSSCYSFQSRVRASPHTDRSAAAQDPEEDGGRHVSREEKPAKSAIFQCTFCPQSFGKKYDWVRHEQSVHLPGLDSWVCGVPLSPDSPLVIWCFAQEAQECIFCGHTSPSVEHFQSHQFEACAERELSARTFSRKDHLVQHLHKFHGCRRREGWAMDVSMLRHTQDAVPSRCGFCQAKMNSWKQRVQHLAAHFQSGFTMEQWEGGCGIGEPMAAMVQGALPKRIYT